MGMANQSEDPKIEKTNLKSIVLIDKYHPHFLDFDKPVVFNEEPVNKRISIGLIRDEKPGFATETSVLYTHKIRIVYSKTESLLEGEKVNISLNDLYKELQYDYFENIPCTVTTVKEFEYNTHAELTFGDHVDPQFIEWYRTWLDKDRKANKTEEKAYNAVYRYYKRLYCMYLSHPFLLGDSRQVRYAFISNPSHAVIRFSDEKNATTRFPISIIDTYIDSKSIIRGKRTPLYAWYENDRIHYFSSADHPRVSPKKLISWIIKKPQWRVLLISTRKIVPIDEIQLEEIRQYITDEAIYNAVSFEESFSNLSSATNILDISCLFNYIDLPDCQDILSSKEAIAQKDEIDYLDLSFVVKRNEPRYNYTTKVTLTTVNQSQETIIKAQTSDISLLGLDLTISNNKFPFNMGDSIIIEFIEWNKNISGLFSKEKPLEKSEYEIVKLEKRNEIIKLGVRLNNKKSNPRLSDFIKKEIDSLKQTDKGNIRNDFDLYESLLSSLWINNNISGLAFFLGRDSEGVRIVQGVVNTRTNLKIRQPYLENNDWGFLQNIAPELGVAVNNIKPDGNGIYKKLDIGVYCYFDSSSKASEWISKTDLEFKSMESKSGFINTALRHKNHFFYHCSLVPIKSRIDDILMGEASSFFSAGAHRLKEIHEIGRSLLAIGELSDVTRLIEFTYKPD